MPSLTELPTELMTHILDSCLWSERKGILINLYYTKRWQEYALDCCSKEIRVISKDRSDSVSSLQDLVKTNPASCSIRPKDLILKELNSQLFHQMSQITEIANNGGTTGLDSMILKEGVFLGATNEETTRTNMFVLASFVRAVNPQSLCLTHTQSANDGVHHFAFGMNHRLDAELYKNPRSWQGQNLTVHEDIDQELPTLPRSSCTKWVFHWSQDDAEALAKKSDLKYPQLAPNLDSIAKRATDRIHHLYLDHLSDREIDRATSTGQEASLEMVVPDVRATDGSTIYDRVCQKMGEHLQNAALQLSKLEGSKPCVTCGRPALNETACIAYLQIEMVPTEIHEHALNV